MTNWCSFVSLTRHLLDPRTIQKKAGPHAGPDPRQALAALDPPPFETIRPIRPIRPTRPAGAIVTFALPDTIRTSARNCGQNHLVR